jgi:hypothetical protein
LIAYRAINSIVNTLEKRIPIFMNKLKPINIAGTNKISTCEMV